MEHVWRWFLMMHRRRQVGMDANPLSEVQIEAFARLAGVTISPLDFDLLCRIDDAVLETASKPAKNPDAVAKSDGAGAVAMMRGMGAKKAKAK